jgi:hypothetical protein
MYVWVKGWRDQRRERAAFDSAFAESQRLGWLKMAEDG